MYPATPVATYLCITRVITHYGNGAQYRSKLRINQQVCVQIHHLCSIYSLQLANSLLIDITILASLVAFHLPFTFGQFSMSHHTELPKVVDKSQADIDTAILAIQATD